MHLAPDPSLPEMPGIQRQLEALVDDLAHLAGGNLEPGDFYQHLLQRTVRTLAATAGAVWSRPASGGWELLAQVGLSQVPLVQPPPPIDAQGLLLEAIARAGQCLVVGPGQAVEVTPDRRGINPAEATLIAGVVQPPGVCLVLLLYVGPAISPAAAAGYRSLASTLCELTTDYWQRRQWQQLQGQASWWSEVNQFVERLHAAGSLPAACYTLANEGRRLLAVDRLSVGTWDGRRFQLQAVSGVDHLERRAAEVQRLQRLVAAVLPWGEAFAWPPEDGAAALLSGDLLPGDSRSPPSATAADPPPAGPELQAAGQLAADTLSALPPQVAQPLQEFLTDSLARQLLIWPLFRLDAGEAMDSASTPAAGPAAHRALLGALVSEQFELRPPLADAALRRERLSRHAAIALGRAVDQEQMPLGWLVRGWSAVVSPWVPKRGSRTALVLALIVAAVLALTLIPADFWIPCRGELQPQQRRTLFAPSEGVVSRLLVAHGSRVAAGETLLVLRRPQLDYEFSRVAGEMKTAQARQAAIQAERLSASRPDQVDPQRQSRLTAEEEELKQQLLALDEQERLLRQQQAELTLNSPLAGQVLSWDVEQSLSARPVQRGQALLTVAAVDGPWELDIRLSDRAAGHVLRAARQSNAPLPVSYILATAPRVEHQGRLSEVALSTATEEGRAPELRVRAQIDPLPAESQRPGAGVVAQIHCGRRALGYVWLHRVIDTLSTWWFLL